MKNLDNYRNKYKNNMKSPNMEVLIFQIKAKKNHIKMQNQTNYKNKHLQMQKSKKKFNKKNRLNSNQKTI